MPGKQTKRNAWDAMRGAWETWQRVQGRTVYVVMFNESIVYERRIAAKSEQEALQQASCLVSERGGKGWRQVGRYFRNMRTRRA